MADWKEIYREFEAIVGQDNVSDDPAVLDSYVTPMCQSQNHMGPDYGVSTPRGLAVLLPGSTEDVQAIARVCNKYRIKFKAASTFWTTRANICDDNAITLDMRRMDRIIEIDERNQFAVIEPYVTGATLQVGSSCSGSIPTSGTPESCAIRWGTRTGT